MNIVIVVVVSGALMAFISAVIAVAMMYEQNEIDAYDDWI